MYKTTTFTSAHHHHQNMIKLKDLEPHPHLDHQTMAPNFSDSLLSNNDPLRGFTDPLADYSDPAHHPHHHHHNHVQLNNHLNNHLSHHHHTQFNNSGSEPPPSSVFYPPAASQFPYSAQFTIPPQLSNYSLFAAATATTTTPTTIDPHVPVTPPGSVTPTGQSMMMSMGSCGDSDPKSLFPSPPASTQMASPMSGGTPAGGNAPCNTTPKSSNLTSSMLKKGQKNGKKSRCKECEGCRAQDCGHCTYCLDKKKFGGHNVIKQACKYRICIRFRSGNGCSTGSGNMNSNMNSTKLYKTPARLSADSTEYRPKLELNSHYSTTPTPPMQLNTRLPSLLPFSSTTSSPEHSHSTGSGSMGSLPINTPTPLSNINMDCSPAVTLDNVQNGQNCDIQQYPQYYQFYDSPAYNWNYSTQNSSNAYHNSSPFTGYPSTTPPTINAITGSLPPLSTPNNCYN